MATENTTGTDNGSGDAAPQTPQRRPRRINRFMVLLIAVLAVGVLSIGAIGAVIVHNMHTAAEARQNATTTTEAAVRKAGWEPVGVYTVDGSLVRGQVVFGNNCFLDVSAPFATPDIVILTVHVTVGHSLRWSLSNGWQWSVVRDHSWPLSTISPQVMDMNADRYGLGDCRPPVRYDG